MWAAAQTALFTGYALVTDRESGFPLNLDDS
jgi:hypothetical protein